MSYQNSQKIPDSGELLVFVGHSSDANDEASAICDLESELNQELRRYKEIGTSLPYNGIKIWEWSYDASGVAGGQKQFVSPFLSKADMAIFVFRDRIGAITWKELEEARGRKEPSIPVLAIFPSQPPPSDRLVIAENAKAWADLLEKRQALTCDWDSEESLALLPLENYSDHIHLKKIVLEQFRKELPNVLKSKNDRASDIESTRTRKDVSSVEDLRLAYENTTPSRHPCPGATIDFADKLLVREYAERIAPNLFTHTVDIESVIIDLGLVSPLKESGPYLMHKAAVLCFCARPEVFLPQARSVFLVGNPTDRELRREDVVGSLSWQVRKLVQLAQENLGKIAIFGADGQRQESDEIPNDVVRELISNAITHRDYQARGHVQLRITKEFLEITNPGQFPLGSSWEAFLESDSVSYPADEAIALYLTNLLAFEGIGRGFAVFRRYIKRNGAKSMSCESLPGPIVRVRVQRPDNTFDKCRDSNLPASIAEISSFDRNVYLDWLRRRCESVELLGLDQRDARNVRLQHVYVPAVVGWNRPPAEYWKELNIVPSDPTDKYHRNEDYIDLPLIRRLGYQSLYVPGAPGAGKSTFCRWLALIIANGSVPQHPIPAPEDREEVLLPELQGLIPVLCYLRDLNDHIDLLRGSGQWTRKAWEDAFAHWLDRTQPGGLNGSSWRALINSGECLLILDGIDEIRVDYKDVAQSHRPRLNFITGLADALLFWKAQGNRVLVTSRPYGLSTADQGILGLPTAALLPLDGVSQHTFIRRWFAALDPSLAEEKSEGLIAHLETREDLRELRESPMLLTALCVKYDEGRRLPRDIHILYHSVINQVLHGRYHDTTEQQALRRRLAAVALGMHTGEVMGQARSVPEAAVGYPELDRILAAYAGEEPASEGGASNAAEKREGLISRSGLLLPRGEERAGFYHLSFQEYLAAERLEVLRTDLSDCLRAHAGTAEWRRTLMFLFCAVADTRPQAALDAVREVLLPGLDVEALRQNPNPVLLLFDCLEIARARGWTITDFTGPLWAACEQGLASNLPPETRNLLWLAAAKLGIDRRPGIGLDATGLPDILWSDEVPPGTVELEDNAGRFEVDQPFKVAVYPVTNRQFQAFIDAEDGYRTPDWWEPEWLEAGWVDPETPFSSYCAEPNAPRESVSWHQAVAFCRWLDHRRRKQGQLDAGEQIRLPTEWEWQQAATRGDPDRIYPWGSDWEPERLNAKQDIGRTTVAGLYPDGASPCGALDMSGNVWEWCLNPYDRVEEMITGGGDARVLRGGSWVNNQYSCRAAFRHRVNPLNRLSDIGFRLCLSSAIGDR